MVQTWAALTCLPHSTIPPIVQSAIRQRSRRPPVARHERSTHVHTVLVLEAAVVLATEGMGPGLR